MGSVGNTGYSMPEKQAAALNKIANRTRNLKNEQSRIVDRDGNVLITKQGNNNEVVYTVGEKRKYMEGNTVIHNHPDGGTFSSQDFHDFGYGAVESWVAAPEGNYKLINLKAGTPEERSSWLDMEEAYNKALPETTYTALRAKAEEAPAVKQLRAQINAVATKWMNARNAGESPEVLKKYEDEYTRISAPMSALIKQEVRKAEVAPHHEWLSKNAKKYNFKYVFEERGRK